MKKMMILGFSIVLSSVLVTSAYAEDARGRVISYDPMTKIIILDDGNAYILKDEAKAEGVQPGKVVVVTYSEEGGRRMVSAVSAK